MSNSDYRNNRLTTSWIIKFGSLCLALSRRPIVAKPDAAYFSAAVTAVVK